MRFVIDRGIKGDDRTFSEEGLITLFNQMFSTINEIVTTGIMKGFEEGEPVIKLEIEVTTKFNGKEIDEKELLKEYPKSVSLDFKKLVKNIIEKNK